MKEFVYAIGDIHGDFLTFEKLLADYEPALQQLVLIGDLIDRGPNSKACLLRGKEIVEKCNAIYLKGNHEDLLERFLKQPQEMLALYVRNGGGATINSLLHDGAVAEYSASEVAALIKRYYPWLLDFLASRPLYYEWGRFVFVHAGVDLTLSDWKKTSKRDLIWIREPFHQTPNHTGKTIVFGHTPTPSLYGDNQTSRLWQKNSKIGIDGGGIYGGSIHGVIFSQRGIEQDIEYKNTYVWQES